MNPLNYPFDSQALLQKKKKIKRHLLSDKRDRMQKRIAILCGSTVRDLSDLLEIFLLDRGIQCEIFESEYNQYFEQVVYDDGRLKEFKPDIIYIHTTTQNISTVPSPEQNEKEVQELLFAEKNKFQTLWKKAIEQYQCPIIQNNFELPPTRSLGNLDASHHAGKTHFLHQLNFFFSEYARTNKNFYLQDLHTLSARFGLDQWYNMGYWYAYKYAFSLDAFPMVAYNLSNMVASLFGKSKKGLVLDLDNTLWGGVVGDDGPENLVIGNETPEGEAFVAFQKYVLELKKRGILLNIASKNELEQAEKGLEHPDMILTKKDFQVIKAHWEPKSESIQDIASALNIGMDSLVFIDDNPAEREWVEGQLPEVATPPLVLDPAGYAQFLDRAGYFEPTSLSEEDVQRDKLYQQNHQREQAQHQFQDYGTYLKSLNMEAEIAEFKPMYMERITQLINKTNQFNTTTRRMTQAEVEKVADSKRAITLYGRLKDKFGDNGLISVVIGEIDESSNLNLSLWLMSCRVLKRGMEQAMFDELVAQCLKKGVKSITGTYIPTAKNKMVAMLYSELGFTLKHSEEDQSTCWSLDDLNHIKTKNQWIKVN